MKYCSLRLFALLLSAALIGSFFSLAEAQDEPFITVWDTEEGGGDNQISIVGSGTDYTIIWEEVGNTSNTDTLEATDDKTINFPNPGVYRVKIKGNFRRIRLGGLANGSDKIIEVTQWGDIEWSSMEEAFEGTSNLQLLADDTPDLSDVTSMAKIFRNSSISATESNINDWDVSGIVTMRQAFDRARNFNAYIGGWDTGNVEDMYRMFSSASSFNKDISSWDVSSVSTMSNMFLGASKFNQDISGWNTSNVEQMDYMFRLARNFDQNLGPWDMSNVSAMNGFMESSGLSEENYDLILAGWSVQDLSSVSGIDFDSSYCNGGPFRDYIEDQFGWNISDSFIGGGCPSTIVASISKQASSSGQLSFSDVGISIYLRGVVGSGRVATVRYEDEPINVGDISKENVSQYRFVISGSGINFFESADVKLAVSEFNGIEQPSDLTVYRRPRPGNEPSDSLATSVDDNGTPNDISDDTLSVTTGGSSAPASGFGEFVLASDSNPLTLRETGIVPEGLTAEVDSGKVTLSWSVSDPESVGAYQIYRSTTPIDSAAGPSGQEAVDSLVATASTYTDDPESDQTYYYRVTGVDTSKGESIFSEEVQAFVQPQEVAAQVSRSFGGASGPGDYRLVALPGRADTSLAAVLPGEAGAQWQAYLHDSSREDPFVKYDGSEAFRFEAGRGFWITSTNDLTFEKSVPTVELKADTAATVGVQEGWNIISNPLGKDVSWSEVEAANGTDLQPIWGYGGSFGPTNTFASAKEGEAYYFYNEGDGPDSLMVPYPGALEAGQEASGQIASGRIASKQPASWATASEKGEELALTASAGSLESEISVALAESDGREEALIAPPGRFEPVSLRIVDPEAESPAAERLMAATRPAGGSEGQTFRLRLTSRAEGPVELSTGGLQKTAIREARLLHPAQGKTYDLREEPTVTIRPEDMPEEGPAELRLAVGTKSYVEDKAESVLPDELTLTSYPNPVRRQGTLEYALPEASEVSIKVYDVLGREVATLQRGRKQAGRHQVTLKTDRLSSGTYFGQLEAGGKIRTQKITVVR